MDGTLGCILLGMFVGFLMNITNYCQIHPTWGLVALLVLLLEGGACLWLLPHLSAPVAFTLMLSGTVGVLHFVSKES